MVVIEPRRPSVNTGADFVEIAALDWAAGCTEVGSVHPEAIANRHRKRSAIRESFMLILSANWNLHGKIPLVDIGGLDTFLDTFLAVPFSVKRSTCY